MVTKEQAHAIAESKGHVLSDAGDKIGSIGRVYVDDNSGEPTWVTVKTGLFGSSESFVPLTGASVDGDDVRVVYAKDKIKDAPRVDDDGEIGPEEENRLYAYYGLDGSTGEYDNTFDDSARFASEGRTDTTGYDTSGPTTDDAMTRSEEQLRVGTQTREGGRARLRKYVVTENVTQTIPVSREEVRVEREPITDANRPAAESGPAISEEEHEVILHEERPVVDKEAVPVERVKLGTETVTEEATVSEEVRKEQIDTHVDTDRTR
jgi:uncharacterized protein (TIGR02271 family)